MTMRSSFVSMGDARRSKVARAFAPDAISSNMNNPPDDAPFEGSVTKVPVEIWYQVFRLVLGPHSIPYQPSFEAQDAVFPAYQNTFQQYRDRERRRAPLRRTCGRWKDVADALDDRLAVVCPDGFIWPPFRDPNDAKRIIYYRVSTDSECPVNQQREKATDDWRPQQQKPVTDEESATIDPRAYIAPTLDIIDCFMGISDDTPVSIPWERSPRSLNYQYYGKQPNSLRALWNPFFHHLTSLRLRIVFPFEWTHPFEYLVLQDLRYLYLELTSTRAIPEASIGTSLVTWRFPKLRTLRLDMTFLLKTGIREPPVLLEAHAGTLEEVELLECLEPKVAAAVKWSKFVALKKLRFASPDAIHRIIPALPSLSTSRCASSASKSTRVDVYLTGYLLENKLVKELNDAIHNHPHAFAQVAFHLCGSRWEVLKRRDPRDGTHILSPLLDMARLAILDYAGLRFIPDERS